jgi:hypothetical protein
MNNMFPLDLSHRNAYANLEWVKKFLTLNESCEVNEIIILAIHNIYISLLLPICLPTQVCVNFQPT